MVNLIITSYSFNIFFSIFLFTVPEPEFSDPCNPSPCGPNAECYNGICKCISEFQGDPYSGCRPECVLNNDCPRNKACMQNKCKDPCPGTCGTNAICEVYNHIPMCRCPDGMQGNAFINCIVQQGKPLKNYIKFSTWIFMCIINYRRGSNCQRKPVLSITMWT